MDRLNSDMHSTELLSLFRDLETANLDRSLRLLVRFFLAEEAGILSLQPIGTTLMCQRAMGSEAKLPSPEELKAVCLEAPTVEPQTLPNHKNWRGITQIVAGESRVLIWLQRNLDWTPEQEQHFQLAVMYIGRSHEVREKLSLSRESARLDQRLSDAAHFSGRIAHDFDNILTGVTGFAELSLSMVSAESQLGEFLREILTAGNRGLVFTQQLHHLSRSGIVKPVPTCPKDVLNKQKAKHPDIVLDVEKASLEVALEASSLQLVLSSLIDNAVEASPKPGTVTVKSRLIELSLAEHADFLGSPVPGPYVEFTITDEGPGIREDILPRLFHEPFVTTKPRHRGLGLPICYRILRVHRAGIRLDSQPSRGTTARVVVPLAAGRKRNTSAVNREVAHTTGG